MTLRRLPSSWPSVAPWGHVTTNSSVIGCFLTWPGDLDTYDNVLCDLDAVTYDLDTVTCDLDTVTCDIDTIPHCQMT